MILLGLSSLRSESWRDFRSLRNPDNVMLRRATPAPETIEQNPCSPKMDAAGTLTKILDPKRAVSPGFLFPVGQQPRFCPLKLDRRNIRMTIPIRSRLRQVPRMIAEA